MSPRIPSVIKFFLLCFPWLLTAGCPSRSGPPDASKKINNVDSFSMLTVKSGVPLYFRYFDRLAVMRTVDSLDQVDSVARSAVEVVPPKRKLPGDLTYVTDLRKKNKDGTFRVWVEKRSSWLDRVMPKKSLLDNPPSAVAQVTKKKRRRWRKRRPRPTRTRVAGAQPAARQGPQPTSAARSPQPKARKGPEVILFSTSWCGACRKARAYFQARRIPYRDLDVEKDPKAGQLYAAVLKRFKMRPSVPIIIVNGRVFGGFSPQHIEAALAQK